MAVTVWVCCDATVSEFVAVGGVSVRAAGGPLTHVFCAVAQTPLSVQARIVSVPAVVPVNVP